MMSELVAGSAWICPPVDGAALGLTGVVAGLLPAAPVALAAVSVRAGAAVEPPAPPPPPSPARAARSVVASDTASAFFRYTTWMLPLVAAAEGWSSRATSERTSARRAGLAARSTRLLLRGSATMVVLYEASPCCAVPPLAAVGSIRRLIRGTRSAAIACCSGMTSTSVAPATSSEAMMRPMRCRLSA